MEHEGQTLTEGPLLNYTLSCQTAKGSGVAPGTRHLPEDNDRLGLQQDMTQGWAWLTRGMAGQGRAVGAGDQLYCSITEVGDEGTGGAMGSWAVGRGCPEGAR